MIHVLFLVNIPLALSEASVMCSWEFQELHVDCVFYSANVCEVFKIWKWWGFRPCLYTWTMHTQNIHTNELRLIEMLGCRLVPFRFTKPCYFGKILSPTFFSIKKELDWTATEIRQQCSLRARFCSDTLLFLPLLQFVDFVGPKRWPLHTYSKIIQWQADACADVTIWQARRGMRSFHGNIRGGRNTV